MMKPVAQIVDFATGGNPHEAALIALRDDGCVILRNLFEQGTVDAFKNRLQQFLRRPAVSGAMGYTKFDHPKKIISPFLIGGSEPIHLTLSEPVIDLIEDYMVSECILADASVKYDSGVGYVYFSLHTDFAVGWKKDPKMERSLTEEQLQVPVGVGAAVYLEDTSEGAFSYCMGTHKLLAPKGQNLSDYSLTEQQAIRKSLVRCDGKAGDMVLFDDRGFHGPHQPSRSSRTVILLDYYRVATFGRLQVTPHPVWTSDIRDLSDKQMRVFGFGADYIVAPDQFSKTRFKKNWLYPVICWLIDHAYLFDHLKAKMRQAIRRTTI